MDFSIQKVALGIMFSAMLVACGGSGEPIVDEMQTSASSYQKVVATAEIATGVPSSTPIEPTEVVIPVTAVIKVTQEEVKEVKPSVTNTMEAPSPTVPVPTATVEKARDATVLVATQNENNSICSLLFLHQSQEPLLIVREMQIQ